MSKFLTIAILTTIIAIPVMAVPTTSQKLWTGNGHYYEVIENSALEFWAANEWAANSAKEQGYSAGYLATVTSRNEWNFIKNNLSMHSAVPYWLGGYQDPTVQSECGSGVYSPADGWLWVTGETWDFNAWAWGQPNDGSKWGDTFFWEEAGEGEEDLLAAYQLRTCLGTHNVWFDTSDCSRMFIVEYEVSTVPAPAALLLGSFGVACVGWIKRRHSL